VLRDYFEITVGFGDEGDDIEPAVELDAARQGAQAGSGRLPRTTSFDSFLDATADKIAGTDHGDLALHPSRQSQQGARNDHGNRPNRRRVASDTEARSYHQAELPTRNRVNGIAPRRATSGPQKPPHKRSASVSSRGSLQITRGGQPLTYKTVDDDADEDSFTDRTTSLNLSQIQIPGVNAPIPDEPYEPSRQQQQPQQRPYAFEPFRPSDTRLIDDAETFEQQRLHRVTREYIWTWRRRTQDRLNMQEDMERAAAAFERRILLKASFSQLRDTALVRRSNRETNHFFERLETRADKARSLFLLTKAFTHWAKCAEDEVQRTSVARRHILRTRFFNGWREITAVNELKIQHFALAKFLSIWRARTAAIRSTEQRAVSYYEDKVVKRTWDTLIKEYLSRGASNWHDQRTARTTLQKWREITEIMRERDVWATDRRDGIVLRKTFTLWQQKSNAAKVLNSQADDFRKASLLRTALHTMQKQAQLEPQLRQVQTLVNSRLLRSAFENWRKDAKLSRRARIVDRMRLLRNTYTAWNDKLRIKALEERINDRILVECLYKWTLVSRVSLFQRVHDRQLKQSTFLSWVTKTNQRANTLDAAERRFAQFKRAQLLRTCLRKMEAITTERRAEQFAVVAEYQQKLKERIFAKLKERQAHFQQLNQWSADARFYVLCKHSLKTWSEATQLARRNRRRDTYSQVRRTVKTNLVRRVFGHWRDRASHIVELNQRANEMMENRTIQASVEIIHQWHDRTLVLRQQDTQATDLYAFKASSACLATWLRRMDDIRVLEGQAIALRQESTEIAAAGALKKMGWRLWNFRRQEDNARALFERNFEKHVRAMIRFWAERATERLAQRPASPTPTRRSRGQKTNLGDHDNGRGGEGNEVNTEDNRNPGELGGLQSFGDETQRLEAWTALDEGALGLNNDLDLSLSLTPEQPPRNPIFTPNPYAQAPTPSSTRPPGSILRRPNTYPQPESALRLPPATIIEDDESDLDLGDGPHSTFWTGTPMPPTASKPGYLKTPSKRSVARAKHPELPASPEKQRAFSPIRRPLGSAFEQQRISRIGSMSAPPVQTSRSSGFGGIGGVTSFERRLREGGFGGSVAAGSSAMRGGRVRGVGGGRPRVGFGNVSQMG
jgi:protein SFI1